VTGSGLPTPS